MKITMNMNLIVYLCVWCALVICCLSDAGSVRSTTEKELKRGGRLGGINIISVNDTRVRNVTNFVVEQINKNFTKSGKKFVLLKISQATIQVVAGFIYQLLLELVLNTGCHISPANQNNTFFSVVKVLDQGWKTPRYKLSSLEWLLLNPNDTNKAN